MSETIKEFGRRLALEALVVYCDKVSEQLEYPVKDLAIGFSVIADLQQNALEAYEKDLNEFPEIVKPKPRSRD